MFCEKCGNSLPAGAEFCEKCGAPVENKKPAGGVTGGQISLPATMDKKTILYYATLAIPVILALITLFASWIEVSGDGRSISLSGFFGLLGKPKIMGVEILNNVPGMYSFGAIVAFIAGLASVAGHAYGIYLSVAQKQKTRIGMYASAAFVVAVILALIAGGALGGEMGSNVYVGPSGWIWFGAILAVGNIVCSYLLEKEN